MGHLETRFACLIAWAREVGHDGQIAAELLKSLWQDIEGSLEKDILEAEAGFPKGAEPCTD